MKLIKGFLEENIKQQQKKENRKAELWKRNFIKYINIDDVKAFVAGIKYINLQKNDLNNKNIKEIQKLSLMISILQKIGYILSAKKIAEIFPPHKSYDGEKYQCKDYYSSISVINKYTSFKNIDDFMLFLFGYYNKDIMTFCITSLLITDKIREYNGDKSCLEEFIEGKIKPIYISEIKKNGKKIYIDNSTGKRIKLYKPHRYLSLVKNDHI